MHASEHVLEVNFSAIRALYNKPQAHSDSRATLRQKNPRLPATYSQVTNMRSALQRIRMYAEEAAPAAGAVAGDTAAPVGHGGEPAAPLAQPDLARSPAAAAAAAPAAGAACVAATLR